MSSVSTAKHNHMIEVIKSIHMSMLLLLFIVPCVCYIISASTMKHDQMIAEVIKSVRQTVGPVAAFKTAIIVDGLPKVWLSDMLE